MQRAAQAAPGRVEPTRRAEASAPRAPIRASGVVTPEAGSLSVRPFLEAGGGISTLVAMATVTAKAGVGLEIGSRLRIGLSVVGTLPTSHQDPLLVLEDVRRWSLGGRLEALVVGLPFGSLTLEPGVGLEVHRNAVESAPRASDGDGSHEALIVLLDPHLRLQWQASDAWSPYVGLGLGVSLASHRLDSEAGDQTSQVFEMPRFWASLRMGVRFRLGPGASRAD